MSRFLSICAGLAVLGAGQCLVMPFWFSGTSVSDWSVAWCSPSSPMIHWVLLYLWTATAGPIIAFAIKKRSRAAYIATIVSFGVFWSFAFFAQGLRNVTPGDVCLIGAFLGLMLWALPRPYRTASSSNRFGMRSNST